MQRKQQEKEVTFISNKENKITAAAATPVPTTIATTSAAIRSESNNSGGLLKKSLYMRGVGTTAATSSALVANGDHIPHAREAHAFRLPTQTNLPM
jgi:hypothetical protein